MTDYVYTARTASGNDVTGKLTANTKREALETLHRLSLFPIRVDDANRGQITIKLFNRRVADSQVAALLGQLADLLENGVPVLIAFQVLIKQTTHPVLHDVLTDIHDRIADGEAIDNAFSSHSNIFNDLTISIIRAGAEGAFLEDALRRTAKFLEQQAEIKGKIISAMIYPSILFFVGISVVVVLLIFFVPQFMPFFDQMTAAGQPLPWTTQSLLWMRNIIVNYGIYCVGAAIFLGIWIQGQLSTKWGIRIVDQIKLRSPLLGPILLNSAVSRFCRVLGTLLENGVPILRSLEISSQSTGNTILAEAVKRSAENVSSGEPLSKPLADSGIIPPQVMAMISIAEESNTLENVLVNIADTIERNTARQLDTIIRLIEPLMLLVMAGAVFYIIVSMLLPIINMTSLAG
ncbi:MAG: type II secretion system F family protein [Planctomycetaceae bacterium]|jgi:general secretion pathway protein F/type IV pilus assembly protein PilC|nr:type II secretion system F family protein [Planctomycetaceae bacterium]